MKLWTIPTCLFFSLTLATPLPILVQNPAGNPSAKPKAEPAADSGVVPKPPPLDPTPVSTQVSTGAFYFKGGSFDDLVRQLGKTYGSNVLDLLEVSDGPVPRIPKMRFPTNQSDFREILFAYNQVSQAGDWYLGKWNFFPAQIFTGEGVVSTRNKPIQTLVFLPPNRAAPGGGNGIAVRAFSIANLPPGDRENLQKIVESESDRLRSEIEQGRYGRQDPSDAWGNMRLHESSGLLVATGGKTYVELVASVVDAFEKKRDFRPLAADRR